MTDFADMEPSLSREPQRNSPEEIRAAVRKWGPEQAARAESALAKAPDDQDIQAALHEYGKIQARKDMVRPAEYHPQNPGGLKGFLSLLPDYAGGGAIHFEEPTQDELIQAMGGKVPPGFDMKQGLADYANAKYQQLYDSMKGGSRSLVRLPPPSLGERIDQGIDNLATMAGSAAHAASFGLDEPLIAAEQRAYGGPQRAAEVLDAYRGMRQEHPVSAVGGGVLGALATAPLLGGPLSVLQRAKGPITGIINGALLGGGVGAGSALAGNANANAADEIAGREGDTPLSQGMIGGGLLGMGLGTLGGLISGASKGLRTGPYKRDLRLLEEANGGKPVTSLFGLKTPPNVQTVLDEADKTTHNAMDIAASKVEDSFASAASERNAVPAKVFAAKKEAYMNSDAGKEQQTIEPVMNALIDSAKNQSFLSGGFSSGQLPAGDRAEISALIDDSTVRRVVPNDMAKSVSRANPQSRPFEANTAQQYGIPFDVPDSLKGMSLDQLSVVVIPKKMNARELDNFTKLVDKAANVASTRNTKSDGDVWDQLTKATREVRDQFRPNEFAPASLTADVDGKTVTGYSALHTIESDRIGAYKKTLSDAGVRNAPKNPTADDIRDPLSDSIRKYRQGEGRMRPDTALEDIARDVPGGQQGLNTVGAVRAHQNLSRIPPALRGLPTNPAQIPGMYDPTGIGIRLDPLRGPGWLPGMSATLPIETQQLLELARRLQQEKQP